MLKSIQDVIFIIENDLFNTATELGMCLDVFKSISNTIIIIENIENNIISLCFKFLAEL